jgi:hypothetical protein
MYQGPKSASFSSESGFFSRGAAECVTFIMTVPVFFCNQQYTYTISDTESWPTFFRHF